MKYIKDIKSEAIFSKRLFILFSCAILILILSQSAYGNEINRCIGAASDKYKVPKKIIELIALDLEKGKPGMKTRNKNNSYDLGVMQINSIHLPELAKYGVNEKALTDDVCLNIDVGTWLLARHISTTGSFAKAIGRYHSKTEKHFNRYLTRAAKKLRGKSK